MSERSRVKRYESLRRKIENQSYFSLEQKTNGEVPESAPDPDPLKAPKPAHEGAVRHNTMTIPISEFIAENDRRDGNPVQTTQEYKRLDETKPSRIKRRAMRRHIELPAPWWVWLLAGLGCAAVAAAIIAVAFVLAP